MGGIKRFSSSLPGVILLTVIFTSVAWTYVVLPFPFSQNGNILHDNFFILIASLLGMLLLPFITIKYAYGRNIKEFGLCLPENTKRAIIYTIAATIIFIPFAIFTSKVEGVRSFYALQNVSVGDFVIGVIFFGFLYYIVEEFLFRGFLFWGLWEKIGYHSFWVNGLLFSLLHLGKPLVEIPLAFGLSLPLSWISLKTKSSLPAAFVHFFLALVVNLIIFMK
ncbi:MAG TPA: type II CAAX endopeptidase family protein [Candidatus Paceibacterota bacterium]